MSNPRRVLSVVLLGCAALVGAGTVLFTLAILGEYGTPSGSWSKGAVDGVVLGWLGVVVCLALALVAWRVGSWSRLLRAGVVAVVAAVLVGVPAAGAFSAVSKYASFPAVPRCWTTDMGAGPGADAARTAEAAFAQIKHPAKFPGGGTSGVHGCDTQLNMNSAADAVTYYRHSLPQAGWTITVDTPQRMEASKGDLTFEVRPGPGGHVPWVHIGPSQYFGERPEIK